MLPVDAPGIGIGMDRQNLGMSFRPGRAVKRNVLVYMVYSDRIIEGSPKNSTSSVPIMPWGSDTVAKCADWIEK